MGRRATGQRFATAISLAALLLVLAQTAAASHLVAHADGSDLDSVCSSCLLGGKIDHLATGEPALRVPESLPDAMPKAAPAIRPGVVLRLLPPARAPPHVS